MNFDAWTVDLTTSSATHECGFKIELEGDPQDPFAVNPGRFPAELTSIEQVRLLRIGVEAIAKMAKESPLEKSRPKPAPRQPRTQTSTPKRPVLSLKRAKPKEAEDA